MSAETPLPNAQELRELAEGLLGREVDVLTGGSMVDPAAEGGALVGTYVDRGMRLQALVLFDLPLAAHMGAAIGLIPAGASEDAAEGGFLPHNLAENAAEVLNVVASLFNTETSPHLRLDTVYLPGEALPNDVQPWVMSYVRRMDLDVSVAGYGKGRWSVLVL
ncbi:hypothetical protein DNL40_04265 [Xylanimonas oleitrophica]|uniref:Uncharacterized protein n=1 Tax=Xylanimonas oleitrophica TaxID=2607479 RepID=A0A2W5WS33_9MICO|nr:hypothetical protein [Xylanimonas oleitrophica]PZR54157.1 hypothetical protein DNL40_04265 [Xylanimonas oleitrophica]